MKKLMCAAASVAALALSMGPAFAESKPGTAVGPSLNGANGETSFVSSDLKEVIDADHPKTLISEIGGQIDAVCAFDVRSPKNYKVDLYNTPSAASQPVRVTYPIKCNFGDSYTVSVVATNGALRNINQAAKRDWDVPYNATFNVVNQSPNDGPTDVVLGALTKANLTYSLANIGVTEASGRGFVSLQGELALAANANNLTPVGTGKTGGFAWRAGVYKETLTMIVTPKLEFAAYYTGAAKQGA